MLVKMFKDKNMPEQKPQKNIFASNVTSLFLPNDFQSFRDSDFIESLINDFSIRVVVVHGNWHSCEFDHSIIKRLSEIPIPVVAFIEGYCRDESLELCLAADIRIASADASFQLGYVNQGRMPKNGATQRLARIVGRGQAMRLLLSGECIDVSESIRVGLVESIGTLEDVSALVESICKAAPIAARYAKESVNYSQELSFLQSHRLENDLSILLQSTEDREKGLRSYFNEETPDFQSE